MNKQEYADALTRTAPPLGISGAVLFGLTLSDWVLVATLVYTLLSIFFLLRREIRKHLQERACRKQPKTNLAPSTDKSPAP